jgi:hypothetical protein
MPSINPKVDSTPLYALAGAGDLALAKLRELPTSIQQQVSTARVRAEELAGRSSGLYSALAQRGRIAVSRRNPAPTRSTAKSS